jgi:hypothetical protein
MSLVESLFVEYVAVNEGRTRNPVVLVSAGTFAGLLAGVLTIVLPLLTLRVDDLFYLNTAFGVFIGNIFGLVISVYAWVVLRQRSVMRAVGFVLSCTAAYVLAFFSTLFLGAGHLSQRGGGAVADSPAWVFFVGGAIGAVVVLVAALLLYSNEHGAAQMVSLVAGGSLVGGILGVVGWAFGPSVLGRSMLSLIDPGSPSLRPYANQDVFYEFSLYLVWQTGMGAVLGVLFSRFDIPENLATQVASTQNSGPKTRSLRVAFICAVVAVLAFFSLRVLPEQYRQARLDRALVLHHSALPSVNNLPKVLPQPPEQMLVLNPIGEYLPGPPRTEESQPEIDWQTHLPVQPTAQRYDVTYTLHGWVPGGGRIEVHVDEYPNGPWAEYMLNEYPLGVSADTTKSFFGNRIFAETRFIKSFGNAVYVWSSANRLVCLKFFSLAKDVPPDEFLKAYLAKYPSSL